MNNLEDSKSTRAAEGTLLSALPMTDRTRWIQGLALGVLVAALGALYFRPFVDLVGIWLSDDNMSHSFLLVPVIAYLVWARRAQLAATERRPATIGLALIVVSLLVLLIGTAGVEFFLMRMSAVGVIVGTVLFLAGWPWVRVLIFPLSLTLLVIPIPPVIFFQLTFPLQVMATKFGVAALELAQIPVLREGNVIWLSHTTLEVTEACSGIRSLLSLFTLAVLYGYFTDPRQPARAVIALSSVPIAILANGLRIAGTGLAAHYIGPQAATGFFHSFSGWVVFMTSLVMLLAVTNVVKKLPLSFIRLQQPEPSIS
jgi:exosortase